MLNYPRRLIVPGLLVLAISFGVAPVQTVRAQRVAQRPQQVETLKTLTLDGKGRTNRSALTEGVSRTGPPPLTQVQRLKLFKGRTPKLSVKLTPNEPIFADKVGIGFRKADVYSSWTSPSFARIEAGPESSLQLVIMAKVGKLYALDFTVESQGGETFTVSNIVSGSTETALSNGVGGQHITAYVGAEDDALQFSLTCSARWVFYSVEVTEL